MIIAFISDIHLSPYTPEITKRFFNFLTTHEHIDQLYILGDLFDAWIGDDDTNTFHQSIIDALKSLTDKNKKLFIMPGNRDFLLGNTFMKQTGAILLEDPTVITLQNTPTLLMHGDLLCTDDRSYQCFRRFIRHTWIKHLYLTLPISIRQCLARFLRRKSQQHTIKKDPSIMDVNQAAVEHHMKQHQVSLLIHGHTHLPCIHELQLNHHLAKRMVLGAWHENGYAIISEPHKTPELIAF